jgi:hypothetical protein
MPCWLKQNANTQCIIWLGVVVWLLLTFLFALISLQLPFTVHLLHLLLQNSDPVFNFLLQDPSVPSSGRPVPHTFQIWCEECQAPALPFSFPPRYPYFRRKSSRLFSIPRSFFMLSSNAEIRSSTVGLLPELEAIGASLLGSCC